MTKSQNIVLSVLWWQTKACLCYHRFALWAYKPNTESYCSFGPSFLYNYCGHPNCYVIKICFMQQKVLHRYAGVCFHWVNGLSKPRLTIHKEQILKVILKYQCREMLLEVKLLLFSCSQGRVKTWKIHVGCWHQGTPSTPRIFLLGVWLASHSDVFLLSDSGVHIWKCHLDAGFKRLFAEEPISHRSLS